MRACKHLSTQALGKNGTKSFWLALVWELGILDTVVVGWEKGLDQKKTRQSKTTGQERTGCCFSVKLSRVKSGYHGAVLLFFSPLHAKLFCWSSLCANTFL